MHAQEYEPLAVGVGGLPCARFNKEVVLWLILALGKYERVVPEDSPHASGILIPPRIYTMPIADLGLSTRACNVLHRNGIHTVGGILEMGEDILSMRNMGIKTVKDVYARMKAHNVFPMGRNVT